MDFFLGLFKLESRTGLLVEIFELLGEHGVDYAVLVVILYALFAQSLAQILHAGLFEVCGAAVDRVFLGLFLRELADFRVDGGGRAPVVAEGDVHRLRREHLPASEFDVHHRLGADDLGSRRDERNPAELFAHVGDFRKHFVELVLHVLLFELHAEVGKHSAGHLVD